MTGKNYFGFINTPQNQIEQPEHLFFSWLKRQVATHQNTKLK